MEGWGGARVVGGVLSDSLFLLSAEIVAAVASKVSAVVLIGVGALVLALIFCLSLFASSILLCIASNLDFLCSSNALYGRMSITFSFSCAERSERRRKGLVLVL